MRACVRQLRVGMAGAFGLDYGAVLAFAAATGADLALVAELLPVMEAAAVNRIADAGDDDED